LHRRSALRAPVYGTALRRRADEPTTRFLTFCQANVSNISVTKFMHRVGLIRTCHENRALDRENAGGRDGAAGLRRRFPPEEGRSAIDHKVPLDESGIWSRSTQDAALGLTVTAVVIAAFWEGGDTRLGKTFVAIRGFAVDDGCRHHPRARRFSHAPRPSQTDDPDKWFQGKGHYSFPSGEVAAMSAAVTPLHFSRISTTIHGSGHLNCWPAYDGRREDKKPGALADRRIGWMGDWRGPSDITRTSMNSPVDARPDAAQRSGWFFALNGSRSLARH